MSPSMSLLGVLVSCQMTLLLLLWACEVNALHVTLKRFFKIFLKSSLLELHALLSSLQSPTWPFLEKYCSCEKLCSFSLATISMDRCIQSSIHFRYDTPTAMSHSFLCSLL